MPQFFPARLERSASPSCGAAISPTDVHLPDIALMTGSAAPTLLAALGEVVCGRTTLSSAREVLPWLEVRHTSAGLFSFCLCFTGLIILPRCQS